MPTDTERLDYLDSLHKRPKPWGWTVEQWYAGNWALYEGRRPVTGNYQTVRAAIDAAMGAAREEEGAD